MNHDFRLRTLLRFGLVGLLGFSVDAGLLHVLVSYGGMNLLLARACSFLCAVTTTWVANRVFTFAAVPRLGRALLAEWAAYFAASVCGGCTNYLVFAAAVRLSPLLHTYPTVAVALGSLAGTCFNLVAYSRYVFRRVS